MSAATFAAALAAPAVAQQDFSAVEIKTTEVAPGIYMMTGAGGNLGVFTGEDGPLLVDDQYAPLSEKIIAAIAEITRVAKVARDAGRVSGQHALAW